MKQNKNFLVGYRIGSGLLGLVAVATEIIALVHRGIFRADNFFSFFTIESNIFAAIILLISAFFGTRSSPTFMLWRGAATLYMAITGIVFSVLLSGLEAAVLTAVPWDNIVLHYIMPVAVFIDWLFDRQSSRPAFRQCLVWLVFPIIFVAYSLVRGHVTGWYPYPFLNPAEHGYTGVATVSGGILILTLLLTWLLVKVRTVGKIGKLLY